MSNLDAIRSELPVTSHYAYLNAGTCGPLPRRSVAAMTEQLQHELVEGRIGGTHFPAALAVQAQARSLWARALGVGPEHIALTQRTTDGLNIVLWGLPWRAGDEIVTTRDEHPGLLVPLAALARQRGVSIRYVTPGDNGTALIAAIGPRTRLLALSHVLWTDGTVLPLAEIVAQAHERGVRVLVDGAQSAGAIPLDLDQLDVDFYAFPGQKWFCGPEGTGGLYVAPSALALVDPTFSGYFSAAAWEQNAPYFLPERGARRYEVGMSLVAGWAGLAASLTWLLDEVGLVWAHQRTAALAGQLRRLLIDLPGVDVLTPASRHPSGLVTFRLPGQDDARVVTHLEAHGFRLRTIPAPFGGVRASTGFYNTEQELESLVAAVRDLLG